MLGHRDLTADEYLAILRRRWWIILVPALIAPAIAFGISLLLPERYVSQTLVLVEQQKVPDSLVKPIASEELQQRLATMQEQILSRTRLQPIIERFGVYKEDKTSMEEKVDRIRKQVVVTPIREETRGSLPGFYVSFTANNPRLAQSVCQEITSMFMTENLKVQEQRAQGTTDFISNQLADAKRDLDDNDSKLAKFKQHYLGQLPDDEQQNLAMLTSTNSQLDAVTQTLNRAQQDKTYMEGLLTQQMVAWHAAQNTGTATGATTVTLEQQLVTAQGQLISMQSRYTPDHPDVVKLNNQIATLKQMIKDADAQPSVKREAAPEKGSATEPPAVQQLRLQLHQIDQMIREKTDQQARLQQAVRQYQSRVQLSPVVEEEYKKLTRDYQTALAFYNDLLGKEKQSGMATDLQRKQQGEQFTVMDPANLPEKPTFPNRPMFAAGGLAGGLALGLGIVGLLELRDKSIRNERDVEFWLQLPTLGMMPPLDEAPKARAEGKSKPRGAIEIQQQKAAEV